MIKKIIRSSLSIFYHLEEVLLSSLLVTMIFLACLQIILRGIFSSGLNWIDPLIPYLVLWSGLLGAAVATRMNKHIAIDLISHLVPELLMHWLEIVIHFFSLTVCLILTWSSVIFVINEASFGDGQTVLGISSWQLNLIFPLAFGLISIHFLIAAVSDIKATISSYNHL
jgi:TRAP-type C4-dicarboxylate transport system permease small subunit